MRSWLKYVGGSLLAVLSVVVAMGLPVLIVTGLKNPWAQGGLLVLWLAVFTGTLMWWVE